MYPRASRYRSSCCALHGTLRCLEFGALQCYTTPRTDARSNAPVCSQIHAFKNVAYYSHSHPQSPISPSFHKVLGLRSAMRCITFFVSMEKMTNQCALRYKYFTLPEKLSPNTCPGLRQSLPMVHTKKSTIRVDVPVEVAFSLPKLMVQPILNQKRHVYRFLFTSLCALSNPSASVMSNFVGVFHGLRGKLTCPQHCSRSLVK